MVARDSAPFPASQQAASGRLIKLRQPHWILKRKLSRRIRPDFAGTVLRVVAIRLYAAVACLISMLLVAWVGAFVRVISTHDWHVFKALDGTTLLTASAQAARYQGFLLPVLLSWAALLLLTPTGYTFAFRWATVAAGILGFLHFPPPLFPVTTRVTNLSHWLTRLSDHGRIPYLALAIAMSYLLLSSAVSMFDRLNYLQRKDRRVLFTRSASFKLTRRLCAMLLILLALLSVTWAVTVIRLAASGLSGTGTGISHGPQGGLYQTEYLFILGLISLAVSQLTFSRGGLIAAVILSALYNLTPSARPFPSILEPSAGWWHLIHTGTAWGPDSLLAALFIVIPSLVFEMYLVVRLLRLP